MGTILFTVAGPTELKRGNINDRWLVDIVLVIVIADKWRIDMEYLWDAFPELWICLKNFVVWGRLRRALIEKINDL